MYNSGQKQKRSPSRFKIRKIKIPNDLSFEKRQKGMKMVCKHRFQAIKNNKLKVKQCGKVYIMLTDDIRGQFIQLFYIELFSLTKKNGLNKFQKISNKIPWRRGLWDKHYGSGVELRPKACRQGKV